MDGYRRDVFAALYRVANAPLFDPDRLVELEAPFVGSPDETWARWSTGSETPAVVIGDGALRYREAISGAGVEPSPLLAGAVGVIAAHRAARGESVHPAAIHPLYVRRPDAEVARDAR
jgi:tRNA A37 threonylcarbamoyladenosine modification protein TsaB